MKKFFQKFLALFVSLLLFTGVAFAEKPFDVSHVTDLWVGDIADTADVTPGDDDMFISGTLEVDGAARFDGAIDANSTLNVSGAVTFGTAGTISATEIADIQKSIPLYLPAGMEDGGNDLDDASTPTLGEVDNVPCLVWDDSDQTTAAKWTFRLPPNFVIGGACGLYALLSSDEADGTDIALDYAWWVNNDGIGFDGTAIGQDPVSCTSSTLDISNEVLDLAANSTAITAFTAGTWVTVEVFNASSGSGTTELKGLEFYFQSTQ